MNGRAAAAATTELAAKTNPSLTNRRSEFMDRLLQSREHAFTIRVGRSWSLRGEIPRRTGRWRRFPAEGSAAKQRVMGGSVVVKGTWQWPT